MGAGGESSVRAGRRARLQPAARAICLAGRCRPQSIAAYRAAVEASGRRFDPMSVGVTRAFFVCDSEAEKGGRAAAPAREPGAAIEARDTARRHRAWRPRSRHRRSRQGQPQQRDVRHPRRRSPRSSTSCARAGVGYVLINGGGSGGGERGRTSLRRFAREVMPHFLGHAAEPAFRDGPRRAGGGIERGMADENPQSLHRRKRRIAFPRHRDRMDRDSGAAANCRSGFRRPA